MNIIKNKNNNAHCYLHMDRTYNKDGKYHGTSSIHPERSGLNFNVSRNNRHRSEQMEYIKETIKPKRTIKKNAVISFTTIVDLPEPYFERCQKNYGEIERYFKDIYESLKEYYEVEEEDVVSAWVHMDETTPHMHFIATPIVREEERIRLSFDDKVPYKQYCRLHTEIEKKMRERGWEDIELINGKTRNGNKSLAELKKETMLSNDNEIKEKKEELIEIKNEVEGRKKELLEVRTKVYEEKKEIQEIDKEYLGICQKHKKEIIKLLNENKEIDIPTRKYIEKELKKEETTLIRKEEKDKKRYTKLP